jgi:hypothetical protein
MDRIKKLFILYVKMAARRRTDLGQDIGRPGPGHGPGKIIGRYSPYQHDRPERWRSGPGGTGMRVGLPGAAASGPDQAASWLAPAPG